MNKYEKAFETIGIYKVDVEKVLDLTESLGVDPIVNINDLISDNLSKEIKIIKEAFAKAELYDVQNNMVPDQLESIEDEAHKVPNEKCPRCGSDKIYEMGGLSYAAHNEPYLDIDGNLCRNTSGGTKTVKCFKCQQTWNQNVSPKKVIIKPNPRAMKK
jgi:DNA-directed RNA polymerase subunit M/transcription elongation factor TFIIS